MENSLKGYKDENIKNLIAKMESGEVPYTLNDLKTFNTEVQERNFEQEYIDRIGELIKKEILKDVPESDYRKNAEINYAEQFGDDEPKEEEAPAEEPAVEEPVPVPEETKIVPTVKEGDIPPIEVPSEVMRASVPEMLEVTPENVPAEEIGSVDKLDVLEEVAVDDDIERLRDKTNKQKEKEDRKEKKKQRKKEANMKKKNKSNTQQIPVVKETPVEEAPVQEEFPSDYYEFEAFPFLSFVAGLNKVLGWIFFLALIAGGLVVSVMYFIDKVPVIAGIMAGAVIIGTLLLIMFYASAEKIALRLEIERHLRYLDKR